MRNYYYWAVSGGIGFLIGQGVIVMWPEWSPWTWWGLALASLPLYAVPTVYDYRIKILAALKSNIWVPYLKEISLIVVACIAAVGLIWKIVTAEPPPPWTHPTLSESEQQKAASNCVKEAMGKGYAKHKPGHYDYVEACLFGMGFVRVEKMEKDEG